MAIIGGQMYLEMSDEYWNSISSVIFNSKNDFEEQMYKYIYNNYNQIIGVVLTFPAILTIADRHRIHLLSEKDNLIALSRGEIPNRRIEVCFSENYIKRIYNYYHVDPPVVVQIEEEQVQTFQEFKKAILDDLMNVIDKHLRELYVKYYT
jgi:hypothetical protein